MKIVNWRPMICPIIYKLIVRSGPDNKALVTITPKDINEKTDGNVCSRATVRREEIMHSTTFSYT